MSSFRLEPADTADAEDIAALVAAMDVALLGATDYSVTELHDEWRQIEPGDRWVVRDAGVLVGYGTVEQNPIHGQTDGYVHPDAFGRGVGAFLVAEFERVLADRGVRRIQNATLIGDERAHALLRSQAYQEIRRFWHMRVELTAEPPAPAWPEGLTVETFEEADGKAFHAAFERVFADHWQHRPESFEEWWQENVGRDDFSPELWSVVRDGDEIVAGTICRPERLGAAWIARLFTCQEWRRRGVGEALLREAFGKFWRDGNRTISLGVDAQSGTGAQRLHERVGMHVHWGATLFEKVLDDAA
jgi:mycothiol synthase